MLKARNIIILFCVNYLIMVFASLFFETAILSQKAALIQNTISVAADMALEQVQVSDDFFTDSGYGVNKEYKISVPLATGDSYTEVNMYKALSGKNNRDSIYYDAFDSSSSDLQNWVKTASKVKTMTAFLDSDTGGITWYYTPKVWQMGTPLFSSSSSNADFNTINTVNPDGTIGSASTAVNRSYFEDAYGWDSVSSSGTIGDTLITYYTSPISLGLTYINKEYVNKLFINNMDLLMRAQYKDLSGYEGVVGCTPGYTYYSLVDDSTYNNDNYNVINNGIYSLIRGKEDVVNVDSQAVSLYNGLKEPKIEYKVIDMYDTIGKNQGLLTMLFGHDANYLKDEAKKLPNGLTAKENRFVVAKVTFYAHVIVPYSTMISREFRGMANGSGVLDAMKLGLFAEDIQNKNNSGTHNFLDINAWNTGTDDDYVIEYTRFFAVAP